MRYLIGLAVAIVALFSVAVYGTQIHVPQDYPTIQMGIDSAAAGDSVVVASGIYYEHLVIDKAISLFGEDRNNTVIDGSGVGDAVRIAADKVTIAYFMVQDSDADDSSAGLRVVECDSAVIKSCHITHNTNGIVIENACYNEIRLCRIDSNLVGINLMEPYAGGTRQNKRNEINNNIIENNELQGICFSHTGRYHHYDNRIFGNMIRNNVMGIDMIMSQSNNIWDNDFIENIGYAITISMCMEGGDSNIVVWNAFYRNHSDSIQAFDMLGNNRWWIYDGFGGLHFGNYWSDYSDTSQPYYIGGGQTSDEYPLRIPPRAFMIFVTNDSGGVILPGVTVDVLGSGIEGITDSTGAVMLGDLGAGFWQVRLSKSGYRDTIINDVPTALTMLFSTSVTMRQLSSIGGSINSELADIISLLPCYPNPFNSAINIRFMIPEKSNARIDVFNILGQHIARIFEGQLAEGEHTIPFEASGYSSGIYFCRLESGGKSVVQKLQLIK